MQGISLLSYDSFQMKKTGIISTRSGCDVLYTNDTEAIQAMITKAMQERKKRLEQAQDLLVEMRPEFAAALKRCQTFSCKIYPFQTKI